VVRHQQASAAARLESGRFPDSGDQLAKLLRRRLEGFLVNLRRGALSHVAAVKRQDDEVISCNVDIVRAVEDSREILKVARLLT
jgi:hypothetical protein